MHQWCDMDANSAIAFVRVVEHGSFRAAAEVLRMPHSTVSRRVAALEADMGVRLLERTTRSLRLTAAGQTFFAEASPAVAALEQAARAAVDGSEQPRGLVRLTAPVMFGQLVMGEILPIVMKQHPEITLAVDLNDRVTNLIDEGFDLALRAGTLSDSTLVARRLGESAVGTFASPAYLARRGTPLSLDDLRSHEFLANGTLERPTPWRFRVGARLVTLDLPARATVNNFLVLRSLCLEGLGFARLPRFLVGEHLQAGSLVAVLPACDPPPAALHAVWPSGAKLPARTRAVLDVLERAIPAVMAPGWPNERLFMRATG